MITVIYEQGVLRPLAPLPLQEQQTVQIQILSATTTDQVQKAIHALTAAGLITPPPGQSTIVYLSDKERRDLADRLGKAATKPLSEIIIEERGE
ncbi:MAG: antitoxin family protein [Anaerolinea sp.]|nr:antitoxin family protein [Anaerolinea sp.]